MKNHHSEKNVKIFIAPSCKTRQQLSAEFGWRSLQTFRTKLRQNGIELPSGSITLKWQKIIYDKLGYPPGITREDYLNV